MCPHYGATKYHELYCRFTGVLECSAVTLLWQKNDSSCLSDEAVFFSWMNNVMPSETTDQKSGNNSIDSCQLLLKDGAQRRLWKVILDKTVLPRKAELIRFKKKKQSEDIDKNNKKWCHDDTIKGVFKYFNHINDSFFSEPNILNTNRKEPVFHSTSLNTV